MKLHVLLILSLICVVAIAAEIQLKRPPIEWQPIAGYVQKKLQAYVDVNSRNKIQSEKGEYTNGAILIILKDATSTMVDGKIIVVRSMVKHVIIDCATGAMIPEIDFYFDVEKPTRLSRPIAAYEYLPAAGTAMVISKTSLIFTALCPVYM